MRVGARLGRGDPPAGAVGGGDPAVQGRGDLPHHERAPQPYAGQPALVGALGLVGEQPRLDLHAGRAQQSAPPPARRGRVGDRVDDPGHAGGQQRVGARPGAAGVGARLEGDQHGAAAGPVAGRGQRHDLGVRAAGPLVAPLADHGAGRVQDDGADVGVGVGGLAERARTARRRGAWRGSRSPRWSVPTRCSLRSGALRGFAGTPASDARRSGPAAQGARPAVVGRPRVLPPIRTFTVGPGVPPGQPVTTIAGGGRVADCHRRLGIAPTPEHAVRSNLSPPVCHAGTGSRAMPARPRRAARGRLGPGPPGAGGGGRSLPQEPAPRPPGRRRRRPPSPRRTRRRPPRRSARSVSAATPPSTWIHRSRSRPLTSSRAAPDLRQHQVEERLAAEAGLHRHQQQHVQLGQQVGVRLDRGGRAQRHAGARAVRAQGRGPAAPGPSRPRRGR